MDTPDFLAFSSSGFVLNWLSSLSVKEKIAQSIFVAAFSYGDESHEEVLSSLIEDYGIGGITFFQGNSKHQFLLTKRYQKKSKVPLFIFMDAEWGTGMRLNDMISLPYAMTVGAADDENLSYEVASNIAKQCKLIGVHSPLAPVLDINNNPNNPVIGLRSFGGNREVVATHARSYAKALRDRQVLDCGKHFPGHGNTDMDSHLDLPTLNFPLEDLKKTEIYPFEELIQDGLSSVMTGHLHVPSLDKSEGVPITLSKPSIDYLKNEIAFKGLVISDAMDMHAISKNFGEVEANVFAYKAGNDILLNVSKPKEVLQGIFDAYQNGEISERFIDEKCQKIFAAKEWSTQANSCDFEQEYDKIQKESVLLNQKVFKQSVTLLENKDGFKAIDKSAENIMVLHIRCEKSSLTAREKAVAHHLKATKKEGIFDSFFTKVEESTSWSQVTWSSESEQSLKDIVSSNPKKQWIIFVHGVNIRPINNFDLPQACLTSLFRLFKSNEAYLCFPANPYALLEFQDIDKINSILLSYQESEESLEALLFTLMGKFKPKGKMPIDLNFFS